uniref:Uncharacterized protein n=1 Tax=Arundo donax TaxID=35708 RepID=A0A0A8YED9_ARUDO
MEPNRGCRIHTWTHLDNAIERRALYTSKLLN